MILIRLLSVHWVITAVYICARAYALRLSDPVGNQNWDIPAVASELSAPFNITNSSIVLPNGHWDSCGMDEHSQGKVVLVTMVKSPCTIQDWLDICEKNRCLGLVLHTFYHVPGLVLAHRIDPIPILEVSNLDGHFINSMLLNGRQLSVSMNSFQPNEWVQYFESREFIWAMVMPASAAACIGILNFLKLKEKIGHMMAWRSVPLTHFALVTAESIELGFRSTLGFGMGTTEGKAFNFDYLIWLLNLIIVINTMSNLTLGLALRDVYFALIKEKPPLNAYLKITTFILCAVIFVLHSVYNIIPRKTGNDQWHLPIIGQIWVAVVVGTAILFLVSSLKLIISFRRDKDRFQDNHWLLRQVSIRLLHCAVAMAVDDIFLGVIAIWTYHSSPRMLFLSVSIAGWTQNVTSVFKMRAILVPTQPHGNGTSNIQIEANEEQDRSSRYLPVDIDETSKLHNNET